MHVPAAGPSSEDWSAVSCHACGVYDASLRQSTHPTVVSVLVDANESARVGIWCARCRGIESTKAAAISLLAGWWSLRGPKLTIAALRTNLHGGEQRPSTNAQMLREIARMEYDRRNPEFASMFARAAHSVQPQRENSRLIDELNRSGYRSVLPNSPWRFAPFVPLVIIAIVLGNFALNAMTGDESEAVPTATVQSANVIAPQAAQKPATRTYEQNKAMLGASADELEKQLTSEFDRDLARAYYNARLQEARTAIPIRVKQGDDLRAIQASFAALASNRAVAPLLSAPGMRKPYDDLMSVMNDATRYYRGGASVDAMERTAGESLNVTVDIAVDAILSEMRGHTERSGALASEVDQRAASLAEMKQDVRVRAAVIALTTKAIDKCLGTSGY